MPASFEKLCKELTIKMATFMTLTVMFYTSVFPVESQRFRQRGELNRIIGGRDAREGEFPYQVSLLQVGGIHFCGGAIINEHNILTVAHCSEFTALRKIRVVAGVHRLSNKPVVYVPIWKMFIHGEYEPNTALNDIALIAVRENLPIGTKTVNKIPLASSPTANSGKTVTVTGWGFTRQFPPLTPDVLQAVEMYVITFDKCRKMYSETDYGENVIMSGMMCAGTKKGEKDSCNGDSGGPAISKGELVGLVSWGPSKCAKKNVPGVYTDVYAYRDWIQSTVKRSQLLMSRLGSSTIKVDSVLLLLLVIAYVLRL